MIRVAAHVATATRRTVAAGLVLALLPSCAAESPRPPCSSGVTGFREYTGGPRLTVVEPWPGPGAVAARFDEQGCTRVAFRSGGSACPLPRGEDAEPAVTGSPMLELRVCNASMGTFPIPKLASAVGIEGNAFAGFVRFDSYDPDVGLAGSYQTVLPGSVTSVSSRPAPS